MGRHWNHWLDGGFLTASWEARVSGALPRYQSVITPLALNPGALRAGVLPGLSPGIPRRLYLARTQTA
jgi:hypothetical protein